MGETDGQTLGKAKRTTEPPEKLAELLSCVKDIPEAALDMLGIETHARIAAGGPSTPEQIDQAYVVQIDRLGERARCYVGSTEPGALAVSRLRYDLLCAT